MIISSHVTSTHGYRPTPILLNGIINTHSDTEKKRRGTTMLSQTHIHTTTSSDTETYTIVSAESTRYTL